MTLPGTTNTILDGQLGITQPASSRPNFLGVSESGPFNTPTLISNQRQLRETFGIYGPLVDSVGQVLGVAGGPVVVTRTSSDTAATYDGGATAAIAASSGAGADNEINLDVAVTAPKGDFAVVVTIVTGGALAATTFTYSLDGGQTTSPTIAADTSVALGTSGVTLEFEAGSSAAYVAGATYTFVTKAAHYSAANLTTAFDAADLSELRWDFYVLTGEAASASAAAGLFTTVVSRMNTNLTQDRYYRAIMGAGDDTAANALTAWASEVSDRVAVLFGQFRGAPPFPTTGRALPHLPALNVAAMRAAANTMSTDLAQTAGAASVGPVPGAPVTGLSHNEYTQASGLDAVKVGTLRTYPNLTGVFLTNVWLKSASGSDFEFWQHGRIMDEACKTVSAVHATLVSSNVIVKADGTGSFTEPAAQSIEKRARRALDNRIGSAEREVGPNAIDGSPGHVVDAVYQVDRTNNVLSTKQLIATISIVPRGYIKNLVATLAYSLGG